MAQNSGMHTGPARLEQLPVYSGSMVWIGGGGVPNWLLFDWGDTLMRTFDYPGPMASWPKVEALPGALELLRSLQGQVGIALATNAKDSREDEIRAALALVGLESFVDRIFCFRSVGQKKSSPPFFTHVLEQLDLPVQQLIMVGNDFEEDVLAANAAGIKAVWFNARDQESRSGADFRTIHALTELPERLEEWGVLLRKTRLRNSKRRKRAILLEP